MKNKIKTLEKISQTLDMGLFYSIRIGRHEISLQGEITKEVTDALSHLKLVFDNENAWVRGEWLYDGVVIKITLTC